MGENIVSFVSKKGMLVTVPLALIVVGFIFVMLATASALFPQAVVSLGVGPYNETISGISTFTAILLFSGFGLIIVGLVTYVSMMKMMH
jgi:hypothetical protein